MKKNAVNTAPTLKNKLVRRASGLMALEQRFMFDGAAVVDAVDKAIDLQVLAPAAIAPNESLTKAQARAEQLVTDFLKRPDAREQLFNLFKGEQTGVQATPEWQAAVDQFLAQVEQGDLNVRVELRSASELQGAKGAFSATGTTGEATIYLNADWVATADSESVAIVLTEELGHYLDHAINGDADTAGDEGEVFAQFVVNGMQPLPVSFDLTGNDHATLSLDGQQVLAELASFNFVNSYEMVYDRDNSTAGKTTAQITTGDIATTERWADKEQNLHYFNASVSLGVVSINDGTNGQNFSGNDVSATTVVVGGTTYHGWISRPIKAGGIVRGFYFWTDSRFTSLAAAQADGNQDGDSTVLNNRGFLFVVDQAWFNTQIAAGTTGVTINNTKDGNDGVITVASVGSSSDRVDSALNSLYVSDLLSVSNLTVNEGSPFAVFTVSGAANQQVTLSLDNQNADSADLSSIEYFNGTSWQPYTANALISLNGSGQVLVRVALAPEQETALDGPETFNLVAKNTSGLASTGGTGTIVDDGSGAYFASTNNTATSAIPASTFLDDDRLLTVNDVSVNEGSPYTVFTVTGASGQTVFLSLSGASGSGSPDAAQGPANLNAPALEYFEGGVWKTYDATNPPKISATGTTLLVRVAISHEQETALDGPETFDLIATNTGGTAADGTATIRDDGTGGYFAGNNTTGTSSLPSGATLDDDRVLSVNSFSINEGSPYAVFTVTGAAGQLTSLTLTNIGTTGLVGLQYFSGGTWVTYSGGNVPLDGTGKLLVRTALTMEQESAIDNGETFTLTATNTGGAEAVGTATVKDDGTGSYFAADDNDGVSTLPAGQVLDDDRALTVSNETVGEATGPAEFDVTGVAGQLVKLTLQSTGTSSNDATLSGGSADVGATLEYYNGTSWVNYTPDSSNTADSFVAIPTGGVLQVRVAITRDATIENNETFYLAAYNTGGSVARGTGTITDAAPAASVVATLALEAGGTSNATDGIDPGGDLATAEGVTLYSAALGQSAATFTPSTGTTTVTGAFGTLTIARDGAWSYAVANANTQVQALRLTTNTLTDTFRYTLIDTFGAQSSSTLSITIQGANDAPVANPDYNTAKESLAGSTGFTGVTAYSTVNDGTFDRLGFIASGNVLPNDSDVDAGDSKSISGLSGSGTATGTTSGATAGVTTLSFSTLPSNISVGYFVFYADQDNAPDNNDSDSFLLKTASNSNITVTAIDTINKTFTLSGAVNNYSLSASTILGFANNVSGAAYKEAAISNATTTATSTVNITNYSGQIAVGMAVSGGGLPQNVNVIAINYDSDGKPISVVISATTTLTSESLTFTGNINPNQTLTGTYGSLVLNTDGSYNYTPFANNASLSEGQTFNDVFSYTVIDAGGLSSTSTLTINVLGSGSNDPNAKSDSNTVTEGADATAAVLATGNVLGATTGVTNVATAGDVTDTTPAGTLVVSGIKTPSQSSFDGVTTSTTRIGLYGVLTIYADGSYSYDLDDSNPQVQKLNAGQSLIEQFHYQIKNTYTDASNVVQNRYDVATLNITINGANDTPTLDLDTTSGFTGYASTFTEGGSAVPLINSAGINLSDVDNTTYDKVSVSFSAADFANGNEQLLIAGATVGGTIGLNGISANSSGTFTLGGVVYDYTLNLNSGTVTLDFTYDGGAELTTAQAETLLEALRYQNTSQDPTAGARTFTLTATDGNAATSQPETSTVTVVPVNDSPLLDLDASNNTSSGVNYQGSFRVGSGTPAAIADTDSLVTDVDSSNLSRATIVLTNAKIGDSLSFSGTFGAITATVPSVATVNGTLTLELTGVATKANYEAAIEAIRFSATGTNYTDRVFNVTVYDDSMQINPATGLATATAAPLASNSAIATLTVLPDNRALTVTGTEVNEASPYVLFTVGGVDGQRVTLDLRSVTASVGIDTANAGATVQMQVLVGGTWTDYTPGSVVTLSGTTLQVRTAVTNDTLNEGIESLRLVAYNDAGGNSAASGSNLTDGIARIRDDGQGNIYLPTNTDPATPADPTASSGTPGQPGYYAGVRDDDRPLSVTSVTLNEASRFAVFTVTGATGQTVLLSLANAGGDPAADASGGQAALGSTLPTLQYYNTGTNQWEDYNASTPPTILSGTTLLVRVPINAEQETALDGPETFNLLATNTGGTSGSGQATIVDDGTGNLFSAGNITGNPEAPGANGLPAQLDDDRPVTITSTTVNEASPYAVFTVEGAPGQLVDLTLNPGSADAVTDFDNSLEYSNDGGRSWSTYTSGFVPLNGPDGSILVRVPINNDDSHEISESFTVTARNTGLTPAVGTGSIVDEGNGTIYRPDGSVDTSTNKDDDRAMLVTGGSYNENSPRAVFTVNANPGQVLTLDVLNEAGPGKSPTGDNEGKPNDSLDIAPIYYSLDGGRNWQLYSDTTPITAGNVPVLVAVDITNERDDVYEGEEQLKLVVTSGGQSASGYASIFDDGTGLIKQPDGSTDNTTPKDDDRPKPVAPPAPVPPAALPIAAAPEAPQPDPVKPPTQVFSSEVQPLAPRLVPVEAPLPLGDILTSSSGFRVAVNETASPGLSLHRGITDQFVEGNGSSSKVSLPYDAFIHSNKDAVIKLDAKLADNSPLPNWVRFDPATGSFEVNPPKDFKGKLDLKVVALDDDGREATALFQLFVGDKPAEQKPQSRNSLTEKLRLAGQRPITLIKVGDVTRPSAAPDLAKRVAAVQRATAG